MAASDKIGSGATWCEQSAFLRRLRDEIARSIRDDVPLSFVLISLTFFNEGTINAFIDFVRSSLRPADFAVTLNNVNYAFALPFTNRAGAEVVAGRIRRIVIDQRPTIGVSTAPYNGTDSRELLLAAQKDAREPRSSLPSEGS